MKKNIIFLLVFFTTIASAQQEINITPRPVEMLTEGPGSFKVDAQTTILLNFNSGSGAEKRLGKISNYFNDYLKRYYNTHLQVREEVSNSIQLEKNVIIINLDHLNKFNKDEYSLIISKQSINLNSSSEAGLFYGIQTLLQLIRVDKKEQNGESKVEMPMINIRDYPRSDYRGMHLDVGRHYFLPAVIKTYIDYLAFHKFNYFHWHLTDDQGWRIEIKKYPLLTSIGGYRNGTIIGRYPGKGNDSLRYGGFYTQDEIRDIVRYASDRYITVIPEIEMPGHASAAIAAYPQLSCFPDEPTKVPPQCIWSGPVTGKQVQQTWGVFEDVFCPSDYTFNFLENVLDEVIALFPSTYIHIGGDECPKENWKRSAFCQKLIKENHLSDEHGLQSYFIQHIEKYINGKGRKIIGWDEILEGGLAPNASVMSWRGEEGGIAAAKLNHNVIMTPSGSCYFDHSQTKNEDSVTIGGFLPLEKVYAYEPIPAQLNNLQAKYVLGAQANLWTEYVSNKGKLEYMIFPRMSALSEVLWSAKQSRDFKDFQRRLPSLFRLYDQWGAHYSTTFYQLEAAVMPSPESKGVLWKLTTKNKDANIIYTRGRSINSTSSYSKPILITSSSEYGAALTRKDHKITGNWIYQKFSFNKATGKKITLINQPSANYPGSGAFTLVNGVITENKLSQSSEWLGFLGKDLEAIIDLGRQETIKNIQLNVLKQEGSWIYLPASVEFLISQDGVNYNSQGKLLPDASGNWPNERQISKKLDNISARYIKVIAKNYGIIPSGQAGAGTPAWLFADEIEVN